MWRNLQRSRCVMSAVAGSLKALPQQVIYVSGAPAATPEAERILDLRIPGVSGVKEYKRFYPAGEVTAQLVGFTISMTMGRRGWSLPITLFNWRVRL